jgi:hypothetical protein
VLKLLQSAKNSEKKALQEVSGAFTQSDRYLRKLCRTTSEGVGMTKNRIDPICKNCVVQHNLSDCVNRPEILSTETLGL